MSGGGPQPHGTLDGERLDALRLLSDVAVICDEPIGMTQKMTRVLGRMCEFDGGQAGCVYLARDGEDGALHLAAWHATAEAPIDRAAREPEPVCTSVCDTLRRVLRDQEPAWWAKPEELEFRPLGLHRGHAVILPIRTEGDVQGLLYFFTDHPPKEDSDLQRALESIGFQVGRVIEHARLEMMVVGAAEEEQRRIGRDLHDTVSQHLAGLALRADKLAARLEDVGFAEASTAREIAGGMRESAQGVRAAVAGLLPLGEGGGGLGHALQTLEAQVEACYPVACEVEVEGDVRDASRARTLYLIASEAVSNSARHSGGDTIRVRLWEEGQTRVLEVTDNGRGIPDQHADLVSRGFSVMRFRARSIDARLEVRSRPGEGTTVRCEVTEP